VDPSDPSHGVNATRSELQRLIASIAHDIRSSVASIVYSADFLEVSGTELSDETWRESVHDICDASRRLQLTVDGLLDFARLGPTISVPVSLRDVVGRAHGLLRALYRSGTPPVEVQLAPEAAWVRGNPLVIEQLFLNLLHALAECAPAASEVTVSSSATDSGTERQVMVRVAADGSFAPERLHRSLAERNVREAAASQEGQLLVEATSRGVALALWLPRSEGPR
jgi:K+-sensing histidine kinase KdpD